MFKTFCGAATVLALVFASAALAQSPEPSPFDTRLAPQAPVSIPYTPPVSAYYPDRAQRMNISGSVLIDCAADAQGGLSDCKVLSETPEGWDFGLAALRAARAGALRRSSTTRNGRITTWVRFNTPESDGPEHAAPAQRLAGTPSISPLAAPGGSIVSFPIAFNRTGVLTEDLTNVNPVLKVVRAKAGAPGFFLGTFTIGPNVREVWCFLTSRGAPAGWVCVWISGREASGVTRSLGTFGIEPYDPQIREAALDYSKQSFGPVFEEKPVDLPETPVLNYRFKRWKGPAAEVDVLANGRRMRTLTLSLTPEGTAALDTAAGRFQLRPAPSDARKAEVIAP
jgi:TonB family protein